MDSTIWAALIGAGASVLIFVAGGATTTLRGRGDARAAAQAEQRAAVEELIRAALDVKMALIAWESRWLDKTAMTGTIARGVAQLIAGYEEQKLFHGAAAALGTGSEWRRSADAAQEALVLGPASRVTAALARIAMMTDPELREAASGVAQAAGDLMRTAGGKPKSAARMDASKRFDDALAKISEAARAYDGRAKSKRKAGAAKSS